MILIFLRTNLEIKIKSWKLVNAYRNVCENSYKTIKKLLELLENPKASLTTT